ncbi:MAG: exodeoxyribonuclease VII large subunit [Bacteroidales bacterium]|nr:exodeoxyribonuclease VII large subunit [Candidatus Cryptobacteroides aphodequi]
MDDCIDLLTLQRQIKEGLSELFSEPVIVKAEVAQMQVRSNGHCYLELVQSENGVQKAKVKAIIWSGVYTMLSAFYREAAGVPLASGQQIAASVGVNYSELYGLSLIINDLAPLEGAEGDSELQRRKTIERLTEEGLMDAQQELALPQLPYRLGVITAPDAAGWGDFQRHLLENAYGFAFELVLFEASMQGLGAPRSICEAVQRASLDSSLDALLVLRGGGSNTDLACFDDYSICAALASCPLPVFTAIGHDRDYHVADMVARQFFKTPTALADFFIDIYTAEDEHITSLGERLRQAFLGKVLLQEARLDTLQARILAADPRKLLERGYSLLLDARGMVARSVSALNEGDKVSIMLRDGSVTATIDSVNNGKE